MASPVFGAGGTPLFQPSGVPAFADDACLCCDTSPPFGSSCDFCDDPDWLPLRFTATVSGFTNGPSCEETPFNIDLCSSDGTHNCDVLNSAYELQQKPYEGVWRCGLFPPYSANGCQWAIEWDEGTGPLICDFGCDVDFNGERLRRDFRIWQVLLRVKDYNDGNGRWNVSLNIYLEYFDIRPIVGGWYCTDTGIGAEWTHPNATSPFFGLTDCSQVFPLTLPLIYSRSPCDASAAQVTIAPA